MRADRGHNLTVPAFSGDPQWNINGMRLGKYSHGPQVFRRDRCSATFFVDFLSPKMLYNHPRAPVVYLHPFLPSPPDGAAITNEIYFHVVNDGENNTLVLRQLIGLHLRPRHGQNSRISQRFVFLSTVLYRLRHLRLLFVAKLKNVNVTKAQKFIFLNSRSSSWKFTSRRPLAYNFKHHFLYKKKLLKSRSKYKLSQTITY